LYVVIVWAEPGTDYQPSALWKSSKKNSVQIVLTPLECGLYLVRLHSNKGEKIVCATQIRKHITHDTHTHTHTCTIGASFHVALFADDCGVIGLGTIGGWNAAEQAYAWNVGS
jgi:hypothetical protein